MGKITSVYFHTFLRISPNSDLMDVETFTVIKGRLIKPYTYIS